MIAWPTGSFFPEGHPGQAEDCKRELIREDRFSTRALPPPDQFKFWKESLAFLGDYIPVHHDAITEGYLGESRAYDLGKVLFAASRFDEYQFLRSPDHIKRGEIDHWVLIFRRSGNFRSQCGRNSVSCGPFSLTIISLAYPFQSESESGRSISLYVPRECLLPVADKLDRLNHVTLEGISARIAVEFLVSMSRLLPVTRVEEVPIFVETALIILKGFAEQTNLPDRNPSRALLAIRLEMAKRYILENLRSEKLEAEDICVAMKLTRRQLYYLFEKLGGVNSYVRSRRLLAVHEAITDPAHDLPLHSVAEIFGFHDAALFSRQFKSEFGYSPKEAREAKRWAYTPISSRPATIEEWLCQVRS
ncbi:MAG: helix-turn-helix domain-containing protein [Rhizobiaceae bacterium]|nr:helix-turn-helix domain-containing protein [Rhizobiaceae bacterium]